MIGGGRGALSSSVAHRLGGQTLGVFGAHVIAGVSGLVFWWLAAEMRPAAEVGHLAVAAPLGHLAGLVVAASAVTFLSLNVPNLDRRGRRRLITMSGVATSLTAVPAGWVVVVLSGVPGDSAGLILMTGPITALALVADGAHVAIGSAAAVALRQFLFGAGRAVLIVAAPSVSLESVWVWSIAVSTVVAILALRPGLELPTRPQESSVTATRWRSDLIHHHVANVLLQLPVLAAPSLVEMANGPEAAASFYVALQIAAVASNASSAVVTAALPRAASSPGDHAVVMASARRLSAVLLAAILLLASTIGPLVISTLPAPYSSSSAVLFVLLVGTFFQRALGFLIAELRLTRRVPSVTTVSAIKSVSAVLLGIVLTRPIGIASALTIANASAWILGSILSKGSESIES